ncbi:cyclin-like protein [Bombardia bombarda]|uniref:Cyclin-like protein n=1 Tax=Bombardia bombarda TaxID=252184 RepID=A0AA39XJW5_9PEZI|nr:cyclin-like protein [Bombardia bombarda]
MRVQQTIVPGNENLYGDENAVPAKQAVHQRHKSASNLKNMPWKSILNAPAKKRTAFGDVSNTARTISEVYGKDAAKTRVKPSATVTSRDSRPDNKENSRMPADIAASKATVHGTKATHGSVAAPGPIAKPASRQSAFAPQQYSSTASSLLAKPSLPSKSTGVYIDRKENGAVARPVGAASTDDLVGLVDKQNKNPRHYKSQPQLKTEQQPIIRRAQSKYLNRNEKLVDIEDVDDVDDNVTEAAYEDAVEQFAKDVDARLSENMDGAAIVNHKQTAHVDFDRQPHAAHEYPDSLRHPKALPAAPALADPEEYWEEEDEQDLYDEQGYTTAHSYRSHGDNTTVGVTTIVAPKVTENIERELEVAKAIVLQNQTEEEIEEEAWDVSMVAEYGEEIFEYMRELEAHMLPNPHYMDIQTEIQWSMRSVLMDWLVQVHHRFNLLPETLFLTVNYIDRFLSVKVVSLGKLQLVGATAIFVAAKYEEINCPSVQEIVYMVDSGYSVEEILKAERFMLSMLQFELGWPGPMSFLRRISKADDYDLETRTLAKYFLEVTIMDERFIGSPPSFIAAGAHCLARMFLKMGDWTPAHVHYSGYTLSQLRPLLMMITECCQEPRKHHGAVFDKYSHQKYKYYSTRVKEIIANGFELFLPSVVPHLNNGSSILDDDDDSHRGLLEYNERHSLLVSTEV